VCACTRPTAIGTSPPARRFYWAPGHAPEALEDAEYVDFSPTEELQRVIEHITRSAAEPA